MTPWLPTLLIVGVVIATILIVRSLSHRGDTAVRADWPGDAMDDIR